jgi:shikimate kinase
MAAFTKQVVLLGMPGAGKSTVGRQLAKQLGLTFCDTDHVLEQRLGRTIAQFFEDEGEARFREVEGGLLQELVDERAVEVIATGGGIVTHAPNRGLIAARCIGIYLRSRPEHIFRRLKGDVRRPLLQVADPLSRLRQLHADRDALYDESASFTIEMQRHSLAGAVNKIAMQLELAALVEPSAVQEPSAAATPASKGTHS